MRDALVDDEPQRLGHVEALHDDHRHAAVHRAAHQHQSVDVIEGQEDQEAVGVGRADRRVELEVVAQEHLVAQQHALRQSRRPAGVGEHQQLVTAGYLPRRLRRRYGGDQIGEAQCVGRRRHAGPDDDHVLETWHLAPDRAHQRQQVVLDDYRHGLGVAELIGDLALLVRRIHRTGDGADLGQREERDDVLRPVGHEQAHAIARPDADAAQGVAEGVYQPLELAERDADVVEGDGLPLGIEGDGAVEQGPVRDLGVRESGAIELRL